MIIKKQTFEQETGKQWPFSVDEIGIFAANVELEYLALGILHNFKFYSLSGVLEEYGFPELNESGIWLDDPDLPGFDVKISLTPIFDYVNKLFKDRDK